MSCLPFKLEKKFSLLADTEKGKEGGFVIKKGNEVVWREKSLS